MTSYNILKELELKFGDKDFLTVKDLVAYKLFGCHTAALNCLRRGEITHIRTGLRRILIPRKAVIEYVKKGFIGCKNDTL